MPTGTIDFFTSQVQYAHHMRPIWEALPEEVRGTYYDGPAAVPPYRAAVRANRRRPRGIPELVCVAAIGDLKRVSNRRAPVTIGGSTRRWEPFAPTVLFEHGVGYSFHGTGPNASYAGGKDRGAAVCLPAVNAYVADANLKAYPQTPSPIIGCPKLDGLLQIPRPTNRRLVVCVSFHWDCAVAPETRWAFSWYGATLPNLTGHPDFELVAHGHPRMAGFWRKWYGVQGIRYLETFEDVVAEADVYLNDSSSTLYEFAAMGRPVVTLNAPWYRRDVHHGLRFWEHADVGLQVNEPGELLPAILETLRNDPNRAQREAAVQAVYPHLGTSAPRAARVLTDLLENR